MRFFIKKLGCPKNDVDGDFIAGRLISDGHQLSVTEEGAEAVVVNTCGFILPAKEESIHEILHYEDMKKKRKISRLYVTGCLSQRYGDQLLNDIKGIDGVFGLGQIEALSTALSNESLDRLSFIDKTINLDYLNHDRRYVNLTFPYEYLKISEGCDRFCSYCAIPYIRGQYQSRPLNDIVEEARFLASQGKKEIILVSQEGSGYGKDFKNGSDIITLLLALEKIEGIDWIRLMYLHPEAISERLINYMSGSDKVLGYFDIPLQHINNRILRLMNRPVERRRLEELLGKVRSASPKNIIRTTFIVGFPGETEEEFEELCDFVDEFEFDRLGVFKYSEEEGTPAAKIDAQISDTIKDERMDQLMSIQQEIAFAKNIALIDTIQKVIIDKFDNHALAIGRTQGDCPDIDQNVIVRGGRARVGEILDARIIMAEGYDLIAVSGTDSI